MFIRFKGPIDKKLKKQLKDAALFFGENVLTTRQFSSCYVDIKIRPRLDASGYCEPIEEGYRNPISFVIEIKKARLYEMISTLAHEMVHLKQYRNGDMRYTKDCEVMRWDKTKVDMTQTDYYELPWEKEAYAREEELIALYEKHLGNQ